MWGKIAITCCGLLALAACGTPATIKHVTEQPAIEVPMGERTKPIQFKKIVIKMKRGEPIGALGLGLLCVPHGDITYRGGRVNISGDDFTELFREELEAANYVVVGDPNALFEDPSEWKAELLVAGLISEIKANICYPMSGFGNFVNATGEAYLKVNWQVYSRLDRKVVYKVATEGASDIDQSGATVVDDIILNAFATATRNLLADRGFFDLVTGRAALDQEEPVAVEIAERPPFTEPIRENITPIRAAVVTVFAGPGHGSGFFIKDGYVLTNQHVVGDAGLVKVKLVTGREIVGEVISSHRRRDVAIVKTERIGVEGLPLRMEEVSIGEQVYAIGTPLYEKFESTLSTGVLSSYRVEDGMKYIQSDVNILPGNSGGPLLDSNGNVIGITVQGFVLGASMAGINYFVPIGDAVEALNISTSRVATTSWQQQGRPEAESMDYTAPRHPRR